MWWQVEPVFSIKLHQRDKPLLDRIQSYLGVGSIRTNKSSGAVIYSVRSIENLTNKIITP